MEIILDTVRQDAIRKLKTSNEDKTLLVDAAMYMLSLSEITHKEGLLSLEEVVQDVESEFLKSITLMVVDGTDPDVLAEWVTNEYWSNTPEGVQAMLHYIYLYSIFHIQAGRNQDTFTLLLESLFPMELRKEFRARIDEKEEQLYQETISTYAFIPVFRNEKLCRDIHELEEKISPLSDQSIQRLLRDTDNYDLIKCIYALKIETRKRILDNLSERLAKMIIKEMVYNTPHEGEVAESVARILSTLNRLQKNGEL